MSEPPVRVLADASHVPEGGAARFTITLDGVRREAFVLRWRGVLRAWANACRHQSLPLDAGDARFMDGAFEHIVCVHHGALYHPDTGECVDGPCRGAFLTPLAIEERPDGLWCTGRGERPRAC
jgi:nitrite reductase/ring-hydroxylating ferredoxin subunit